MLLATGCTRSPRAEWPVSRLENCNGDCLITVGPSGQCTSCACAAQTPALVRAQLAPLAVEDEPGHVVTDRVYTVWGPVDAQGTPSLTVRTEHTDTALRQDWQTPPPTPPFPFQGVFPPAAVCEGRWVTPTPRPGFPTLTPTRGA